MTNYHAWKRRLWGPDYPVENGPPYQDPATGAPMLPGGAQSGPFLGIDDDGPDTANSPAITFSGTATDPITVVVFINDTTAASGGQQWVGASVTVPGGTTANALALALEADFEARNHTGWIDADVSGGQITFNAQSAGNATATVLYAAGETSAAAVMTTAQAETKTAKKTKAKKKKG